jgi:raffinose/stachyose/melibiose transport system permease protein
MTRSLPERLATHAILVLLSLLAVIPLLGLVLAAFNGSSRPVAGFVLPSEWTLDHLAFAWGRGKFALTLRNSAIIAIATVIGTTFLAALAGYAFAVTQVRYKNALFLLFLIGLVVPSEAMIVPLYYDIRQYLPFLRGSHAVIVLPQIGKFLAFGVFWMRAAFAAIPHEITEAARLDGARSPQLFGRVMLPLVKPALTTLAVLVFMWSWNDFLLPLVMLANNSGLQTAPLALAAFVGQRSTDVVGLSAASLIVSVPIVLFFVVFQRQLIRGVLHGALQ